MFNFHERENVNWLLMKKKDGDMGFVIGADWKRKRGLRLLEYIKWIKSGRWWRRHIGDRDKEMYKKQV